MLPPLPPLEEESMPYGRADFLVGQAPQPEMGPPAPPPMAMPDPQPQFVGPPAPSPNEPTHTMYIQNGAMNPYRAFQFTNGQINPQQYAHDVQQTHQALNDPFRNFQLPRPRGGHWGQQEAIQLNKYRTSYAILSKMVAEGQITPQEAQRSMLRVVTGIDGLMDQQRQAQVQALNELTKKRQHENTTADQMAAMSAGDFAKWYSKEENQIRVDGKLVGFVGPDKKINFHTPKEDAAVDPVKIRKQAEAMTTTPKPSAAAEPVLHEKYLAEVEDNMGHLEAIASVKSDPDSAIAELALINKELLTPGGVKQARAKVLLDRKARLNAALSGVAVQGGQAAPPMPPAAQAQGNPAQAEFQAIRSKFSKLSEAPPEVQARYWELKRQLGG